MKTTLIFITAIALIAVTTAGAAPTPPRVGINGTGGLRTFGTADVRKKSDGSYVIRVDPGEYGGIYSTTSPHATKLSDLKFKFKSNGDVQGGAPRWSIPIDTNDDRNTTEGYAFIDAAGCGGIVGTNDSKIETVVSTSRLNCHVNFLSVDYANWVAFYTVHPTYRISLDTPFIIADVAGKYHVYKFVFG
jgi:hypothetical protein